MNEDVCAIRDSEAHGAAGAVILGCGRSGTSAVARSLVMSGFFAGDTEGILGPSPSNPTGHYEPLAVLELNEALLAEHGSTWWAEPPSRELDGDAVDDARRRAREALERLIRQADGAPVVVKEPRINGLLDFWGPALEGHLHPVLVVRNPIEVARSLARRDGNPLPQALAAWEIQSTEALRWAAGRDLTVAHYAHLSGPDEAALSRFCRAVAGHLDPARAGRIDPDGATGALDPDLRHHHADDIDLDEHLTVRQRQLWDYLAALPSGDQRLAVPEHLLREPRAALATTRKEGERLILDGKVREAVARADQMSADLVRVERERQAATLTAAATMHLAFELNLHKRELQRLLAAADGERVDLGDRLAAAEAQMADLEARRADAERELVGVERSLSWRLTRPLRALKALGR